ncbi:MAG TPA: hypothetical protein VJN94_09465 [Candidatus Binataceae bacterium]|nr:hypothetical protein [Candidatus Binataceae bacterium]
MQKRKSHKLSDDQLAEELLRRRDESIHWKGRPSSLVIEKGDPTVVFSLRLTVDELEYLRERASTQGMTVSAVIRNAVFGSVTPAVNNASYTYNLPFGSEALCINGVHGYAAVVSTTILPSMQMTALDISTSITGTGGVYGCGATLNEGIAGSTYLLNENVWWAGYSGGAIIEGSKNVICLSTSTSEKEQPFLRSPAVSSKTGSEL